MEFFVIVSCNYYECKHYGYLIYKYRLIYVHPYYATTSILTDMIAKKKFHGEYLMLPFGSG